MIQPYVKNTQIFQCPSAPRDSGITPGDHRRPERLRHRAGFRTSYAYNYYLAGNNNASTGVMTSSLPALAKPAQTVLLVDGATRAVAGIKPEDWPVKRVAAAVAGFPTTAGRVPYLLIHAGSNLMTATSDHGAPMAYHSKMTNVLWADGHSKPQKTEGFYALPGDTNAAREAACDSVGQGGRTCSPCLVPELGCL